MELLYFFYAAVFYLGAILGSFLNVVCLDLIKLFRENDLENRAELPFFAKHVTQRYFWRSILSRRSRCDDCEKELQAHELFPLVSYLFQGAECTRCKTYIAPSHFFVELAAGFYFLGIYVALFSVYQSVSLEFILAVLFWFSMFGFLFTAALFDLRTKLLPNILLLGAYVLVIANLFVGYPWQLTVPDWKLLASAALFASLFYGMWLVSAGRWMGFADAKLAALFGLLLGFSAGFTGLAISFWVGAGVSLGVIAYQRLRDRKKERDTSQLHMQSAVPFGPFLVFGLWFVFVSGINLFVI